MNSNEVLKNICLFLKQQDIKLSSTQGDGRTNSTLNEIQILEKIEKEYKIDRTQYRDWADFFIDNIPINIKITTTKTADNVSSKKGLYYALTGQIYYGEQNWENYLKSLKENIKETKKDYYFLIINKNDPQDIFFNSLKCIKSLVPNGNNLPFQINWNDNREVISKNFEEAKKLLLSTLGKSLQLRSNAYISFKKYFKEFIS